MQDTLIIVPCGMSKIWNRYPDHGPARAADAYTSTLFRLNRAYAERFGTEWQILSAKYGFISPDFIIDEPYDVTFNRANSGPITEGELKDQIKHQSPRSSLLVVGLGGAAYRQAILSALEGFDNPIVFPFAGLPLGKMLQATKAALETGSSGIDSAREHDA